MKKLLFSLLALLVMGSGCSLSDRAKQAVDRLAGEPVLVTETKADGKYKPLTVPDNVRVIGSEPRQIVWSALSEKEKNLATHLLNAARAGRLIIYNQNHRHALLIKTMIESSLRPKNVEKSKALLGADGYKEFLNYAAKFEDQMGPYASSNRKYVLSKVTAEQVTSLFKLTTPHVNETAVAESVRLLTDREYEVISQPEDELGTDLENSGGNLYAKGITGAEVTQAFKDGLKSDVNCRIVKNAEGKLECEVQALSNPKIQRVVRRALTKVVKELTLALPYATTDFQKAQIEYLIKYLLKGDVEDFRQMNIAWVKDGTKSTVDFMMGYVEVYQDYHSKIGAWESYVQIVDPKTTQLSVNLAKNAQAFEDNMPYGIYKKTFPADYSPPALMVYYFSEISAFHSGGYNLPNYDDIRRDVGAKNIIRLDLPGQDVDATVLQVRREMYEEFLHKDKVDGVVNEWTKGRQAIVLLHEIIGHGSGTYDTTMYGEKEDPISALGALGSSLEEQRADLAALSFAADQKLVDVGFYKDLVEAKRNRNQMYDAYLGNFLKDVSRQQSLSQAHQRGRWLLVNLLMKAGAVEKVSRDGSPMTDENFVLAVKDYDQFFQVGYNLLAELQRIKAVRDETALKKLFSENAPLDEINKPWLQAIIKRGAGKSYNAGSIEQPWVIKNSQVQVFGTPTLEGIAPHLGK